MLVTATGSATPRQLQDRFADVVNVKDYGAKGDGVTDDTATIQAAITAGAGKRIIIHGGGNYLFSTLSIAATRTELCIEEGAILTTSTAGSVANGTSAITVSAANVTISGSGKIVSPATFDGSNAAPSAAVIKVTADGFTASGITLENVPRNGIWFNDATGGIVEGVRIVGGYPYASYSDASTTGHTGIMYDPPAKSPLSGSLVVTGSRIESCIQGILAANYASGTMEGVTIVGNSFNRCWDHGVYMTIGQGFAISGNTFLSCRRPIVADGNGGTVVGNSLFASETGQTNYEQQISVRGASDTVIADNVVHGLAAAILVDGIGSQVTIRRNAIRGNVIRRTGAAVTVGNAPDYIRLGNIATTVDDNLVEGNLLSGTDMEANTGGIRITANTGTTGNRNIVRENTIALTHPLGSESYAIVADHQQGLRVERNTISGILASDAAGSPVIRGVFFTSCSDSIVEGNSFAWKTTYATATPALRGIQSDANCTGSVYRLNKFDWSGTGGTKDRLGFIDATSSTRYGNQQIHGIATIGTAVLVAGTVTVNTSEILAGDVVRLSRQAAGGTLGILSVGTITGGTSFVINSSNAADTSMVAWEIVH